MARTDIDIDITEVMRRFRLETRREGLPSLVGIGWDGDLDAIRSDAPATS